VVTTGWATCKLASPLRLGTIIWVAFEHEGCSGSHDYVGYNSLASRWVSSGMT